MNLCSFIVLEDYTRFRTTQDYQQNIQEVIILNVNLYVNRAPVLTFEAAMYVKQQFGLQTDVDF